MLYVLVCFCVSACAGEQAGVGGANDVLVEMTWSSRSDYDSVQLVGQVRDLFRELLTRVFEILFHRLALSVDLQTIWWAGENNLGNTGPAALAALAWKIAGASDAAEKQIPGNATKKHEAPFCTRRHCPTHPYSIYCLQPNPHTIPTHSTPCPHSCILADRAHRLHG